ncbi:uncharacterized protein LOC135078491 [Ostrinia nubilalis]|uniref:uncharacterized protein LOC135078491 n=1 Tax=Ostrinia nubilalis TaxID=29057 RepID=UPI003082308B
MFCTLFFIFITLGRESETSLIRVDTSGVFKKMERVAHGYFNTINQLSKQFPNHQIELQIEYSGPVTKKPSPLPFRRGNVRVVKYPKKTWRSDNNDSNAITMTTAAPTTATTTTLFTSASQINAVQEPNKSPIYLDDLKQALDEFEKKLASHSDCSGNHQNTATTAQKGYSPRPIQAHRNIQEIMQLIGKGVKVQYNVPKPTDDDLDWLQIKIPNSS